MLKNSEWMSEKEQKALCRMVQFATKKHDGEFRRYTQVPYIVHPLGVMQQLGDWHIFDLKTWHMALGHDLAKVCPELMEDWSPVARIAGWDAVDGIKELTFVPNPTDPRRPQQQKKDFLASWLKKEADDSFNKSIESLVVKISDCLCNVWDFIQSAPGYAPKYFRRGSGLFEAMMTRSDEIIERYGIDSFPLMRYTYTEISAIVA